MPLATHPSRATETTAGCRSASCATSRDRLSPESAGLVNVALPTDLTAADGAARCGPGQRSTSTYPGSLRASTACAADRIGARVMDEGMRRARALRHRHPARSARRYRAADRPTAAVDGRNVVDVPRRDGAAPEHAMSRGSRRGRSLSFRCEPSVGGISVQFGTVRCPARGEKRVGLRWQPTDDKGCGMSSPKHETEATRAREPGHGRTSPLLGPPRLRRRCGGSRRPVAR